MLRKKIAIQDLQRVTYTHGVDLAEIKGKIDTLQDEIETLGFFEAKDLLSELKRINKPYAELEETMSELEYKVNRDSLGKGAMAKVLETGKELRALKKTSHRKYKRIQYRRKHESK